MLSRLAVALLMTLLLLTGRGVVADDQKPPNAERQTAGFRGALLSVAQVTEERLHALADDGFGSIILDVGGSETGDVRRSAIQQIAGSELQLYYWIEVARCPALADTHPEWMASLQGHDEWRRLFDKTPVPATGEVVKNYPWVPILNKEPFEGQLNRIRNLLSDLPTPVGVLLNDIQGAPSACGCGNSLCRWTSDYGKLLTSTPLGNDAPARFVTEVRKLLPDAVVIPVWTTECEELDGAKDGFCAGVGCFNGICWQALTEQLTPVAQHEGQIGVLLPYRAFGRDLQHYGQEAGWISHAVESFQTMPVRHQGTPVSASRLLTVIQGWDVTRRQIDQQELVAKESGVADIVVAFTPIEQSWQPKIYPLDAQK